MRRDVCQEDDFLLGWQNPSAVCEEVKEDATKNKVQLT